MFKHLFRSPDGAGSSGEQQKPSATEDLNERVTVDADDANPRYAPPIKTGEITISRELPEHVNQAQLVLINLREEYLIHKEEVDRLNDLEPQLKGQIEEGRQNLEKAVHGQLRAGMGGLTQEGADLEDVQRGLEMKLRLLPGCRADHAARAQAARGKLHNAIRDCVNLMLKEAKQRAGEMFHKLWKDLHVVCLNNSMHARRAAAHVMQDSTADAWVKFYLNYQISMEISEEVSLLINYSSRMYAGLPPRDYPPNEPLYHIYQEDPSRIIGRYAV